MLIVGRKPVLEALKSHLQVKKVVHLLNIQSKPLQEIFYYADERTIPIEAMNKKDFQFFVKGEFEHSQGIAAIVEEFRYSELDDIFARARGKKEKPFIVILDEIEDPHNLGALIRTAECAGAHGVIVPKHHSAPITPVVMKTSAGAAAHLPIVEVTNIVNTIEELKKSNVWIVGTDVHAPTLYYNVDYTDSIAIVIGNEGRGVRRLVLEHCDFVVTIPMMGELDSLNASVAGGVLLFEVVRARHLKN
ncbi:MAG TPA: 23S rRNA (guanosine(2251)-2'-O)-methyltransferase RlmB [Bacteroidota bacterium]|jgi:23S rRNA (guanosine2251-2'-O)-methyltransferase|nr:23S rRNA (guanosine(2251)-2'-O)-methyltransferase RlmB [Bacteroidota bacterium]